MTIRAQLLGAAKSKKIFEAIPGKVKPGLQRTIRTEALNIVAYVKKNKLSDQILKVQTGRLRRSITAQFSGDGDSFQAMIGTNVRYGRVHEFGFKGDVNVPEHKVKEFQRMQSQAFGRPMKNPRMVNVRAHVVKAHTMKMNMPARPFLQPSVQENLPRMTKNLRAALAEALK